MPEPRESLLRFPCRFPIKAMGRTGEDFDLLVARIVRRHAPDFNEAAIRLRESSGGKWVAVTVVIQARSQDQLDAIYRDLSAHKEVVWAV